MKNSRVLFGYSKVIYKLPLENLSQPLTLNKIKTKENKTSRISFSLTFDKPQSSLEICKCNRIEFEVEVKMTKVKSVLWASKIRFRFRF
jgi:hypothetical protein